MPSRTLISDAKAPPPHRQIASERVEGTKACCADGKKIGVVERVMTTSLLLRADELIE